MVKGICARRSEGKAGSQISLSSFYNMQMHLLTGTVYLSICTTLIRLHYLKLLFPPRDHKSFSVCSNVLSCFRFDRVSSGSKDNTAAARAAHVLS